MIKSIGLVNFLSHKETYVEFVPGLNVIAGDSDKGKSSVLRGITWVAKDKPSGDAIKNWDAGKKESVAVEMVLINPTTGSEESVIKERIGSTSSYTLSTLPEPLGVVGKDVPTEVLNMLNLAPLNFKGQHEQYALDISPGKLAKMINELVGLSIIDVSLKNLNTKIVKLKTLADAYSTDIERYNQDIDKLSYLEQMDADISELEQLEKTKREYTVKVSELSKIIENIEASTKELKEVRETLKIIPQTKSIDELLGHYGFRIRMLEDLSITIKDIETIQESLIFEKGTLEALPDAEALMEKIKKWDEQKKEFNKINPAINSATSLTSSVEKACKETKLYQKQTDALLKKMGVCPTCKRPLDQKTIDNMVNI